MPITMNSVPKVKSSFPVRNIKFNFESSPRYWFDHDPLFSHLLNGLSGIFPQGELFLITTLRTVRQGIKDSQLQADISAFIGQEAMHSKEHTAFNRYADQHDIDIETLERQMKRFYTLMDRILPAMHRMAIGCAIEHCTATLGAELLRSDDWHQRMVGPLRELWVWHALEENEHKAVFFDAYQAAGGGYLKRVTWMAISGSVLVGLAIHNCVRLLHADQKLLSRQHLKSIAKGFHPRTGIFNLSVMNGFIDYFYPSFHPFDHDTQQLEQHWRQQLQLKST
ncbi:metal-dependent hydrolase [Aquirhabdus sp.]|uniref:metal-dependent hydrolase n=1 Tax=Aquirhabdus sp. TaxID=2824160 RepID=UPI00396CA9E3